MAVAALGGDWVAVLGLGAAGLLASRLERAAVIELTTVGLTRETRFAGVLVRPARVLPWHAIEEIRTAWRGPRDFTGLETVVRATSGDHVRFGTRMGLRAYRALVGEVARRARDAARTGLTDQLLSETPTPRRRAWPVDVALVVTAAVLLLIALVV
jgi:hypothetical protein